MKPCPRTRFSRARRLSLNWLGIDLGGAVNLLKRGFIGNKVDKIGEVLIGHPCSVRNTFKALEYFNLFLDAAEQTRIGGEVILFGLEVVPGEKFRVGTIVEVLGQVQCGA